MSKKKSSKSFLIDSPTKENKKNKIAKKTISMSELTPTQRGRITKTEYFKFLNIDLDDYEDIQMTKKQANHVYHHLRKLSTGASAMVPIYCSGSVCPFADRCPLVQMRTSEDPEERGHPEHGKAPVGRQCLIESQLMKEWVMRYFEEFDIDPNNFTEVAYVSELADLMVLEMRVNMNLAKAENAALVIDQTVGVDRDGEPITQKQVSPFLDIKERINNRRSKIITLMVGDRREKYKKEAALKIKIDSDSSSEHSEMRLKLEKLKRELDNVGIETPKSVDGEKQDELSSGPLTPEDLISSDE